MLRRVIVTVALASAALAPPAGAATRLTATVKASPGQVGGGVKLDVAMRLATPAGEDRPIVTGFELWTGPGLAFNGGDYATCDPAKLLSRGPSACPSTSILGTSTMAVEPPDLDLVVRPTMVNVPGGRTAAYLRYANPARVQRPALSTVTTPRSGPWRRREAWAIPRQLQVVAGVPITPSQLRFSLGGKSYASRYVEATDCPAGGWAWRTRVLLRGGTALSADGHAPCRGGGGLD
jgi:hypothetical protein